MGPLPAQPSLFADGDLETIMPAAENDPELWQDIVASYIPVKLTHSADSEDDEMFEEVLPPTNGLKANGHQIQPEQAHPDSDNDALEHVDLDPVPPMSISNDAQDTPATHIEEAVVCRDYAIPESEASKYRESPAAAYQAGEEEEEELDAGPSIVAAALATHESDSDSDLEQVTPVLAKASPAPLPPVKAAPAFQTREVSMSPPPLVRPRRKTQVDPPAPVASTSKVTLEVPLAAQDLIPAAKNVSAPHTIVPTQHLLPKRTVSGSKQWPSASNSAIPQQRQDTPSGFSDGSVEQAILQHVLEAQAKPTEEPLSRAASPDWADEPMEVTHKSASDWSRSPSPVSKGKAPAKVYGPDEVPDDFPLLAPGHELSEEEMDAGDRDDLEMAVNVQDEASRFSSFLNQLQKGNLDQVRGEVEAEISQLRGQRKKDRRDAEDITQQMSKDIQGMLRLFGLPFVIAPMEAEAQCAELYRLNLVDGIITDDSDVFLFEGGSKIYKNLFNQAKYVELYLASDVQRELGLERDDLIKLGYLLGSDYTSGIKGVGPVGALEIMKEFGSLENFRDWWRKVQRGQDDVNDTDTAFKRRFKKAQLKKELYLEETWPDPEVRKAYTHPSVDNSAERFLWGIPDLDGLRGYLAEHLGWSTLKVDDLLTPLIKRMQQRLSGVANMQGTLDSFFDTSGGTGRFTKCADPCLCGRV
jgi:DNA excision repair protein ERCC-5